MCVCMCYNISVWFIRSVLILLKVISTLKKITLQNEVGEELEEEEEEEGETTLDRPQNHIADSPR